MLYRSVLDSELGWAGGGIRDDDIYFCMVLVLLVELFIDMTVIFV